MSRPNKITYRIKVGDPPESESITSYRVKLIVIREVMDADGQIVGKPQAVRDPRLVTAWSHPNAVRKAIAIGRKIVAEDQASRGVRITESVIYRT